MIIQQAQKKRLSDLLRSLAGAATFRALGNQSFALLWSGQTLSRIGDFLYQVALAWWVVEHTGLSSGHGQPGDRVIRADPALSADWRRRRRPFLAHQDYAGVRCRARSGGERRRRPGHLRSASGLAPLSAEPGLWRRGCLLPASLYSRHTRPGQRRRLAQRQRA